MASLALGVKFNATSAGTVDFVYSSAVAGYVGPAATSPPMVNGKTYRYRAESADLTQWEFGSGPYNSATQTIARTTIALSSTGAKVSFTAAPIVGVVPLPDDILQFDDAMSLTSTQKNQARTNIAAFGRVKRTLFTASGTWTPDPKMLYAFVEGVGAGGSSGGLTGVAATFLSAGGGAGAEYAFKLVTAADVSGLTPSVTIGAGGSAPAAGVNGNAGGDTSVGALLIAKGGAGGVKTTSTADVAGGSVGGNGGTGDFKIPGKAGGGGFSSNTSAIQAFYTGFGGASHWSGSGITATGASLGTAGSNYGGGASGPTSVDATSRAGSAGAAGAVIITEFCSE